MARKLASIVAIDKVLPIEGADKLEKATIVGQGWEVVTAKGEFKSGDLAVYFQIDSYLPPDDERYAFLRDRCLRKFVSKSGQVLRDGLKIKTIKLRGVLSQGLLIPIDKFPEVNRRLLDVGGFWMAPMTFVKFTKEDHEALVKSQDGLNEDQKDPLAKMSYDNIPDDVKYEPFIGADVTKLLHVEHFDEIKEMLTPACGGSVLAADTRASFPSAFAPKSDEDRIQQNADYFEKYKDATFEITAKDDGSSMTVAYSPMIDVIDPFIVCSRNRMLKRPDAEGGEMSAFWKVVQKYGIEQKLKEFFTFTGLEYAVQGELVGPGVNGDRDKYLDYEFHVFRIWDIKAQKFVEPEEREKFCKATGIPHVQILERHFPFFQKFPTMQSALKYAEGKTLRGNEREGVVLKQDDGKGDLHFKIVSNRYLLKQDD